MRLKKYILLFILPLTFSSARSQFLMRGRVLEVNSGGKGLSGVKVFSKYSVDTVLTDSEGYFNINLSEQSYLAVAGLSFLKRGFLVNNPGALFNYKVGGELTVYLVDVIKRENAYHQLTETWWKATRIKLVSSINGLDSTSKSFYKDRRSLLSKSHQSDVFYKRALKYLAYLNLDELPLKYQEVLKGLGTGDLDKSSIQELEASSSKEKSIKQVLTNLEQAVNLRLDLSECNCYCMSTLEHGGLSSYVGRVPPYNSTKVGFIKSEITYDNLVKNLSFYSMGRKQFIDPQRLQKAWEILVELKKINNSILLEEEMLIRVLAIDNIPYARTKRRNDFFTPATTIDYLLKLKAEHVDFFNIEISNLSHISMEIDFKRNELGENFLKFYKNVALTRSIPLQERLSEFQFLNHYFDYIPDDKVFELLVDYESQYPLRPFQGRGEYFLQMLHEKYLKNGDWDRADTLLSIFLNRRNRFYLDPDNSSFLARHHYLKAMRLWDEGTVREAKISFDKFGAAFLNWKKNIQTYEKGWDWEDDLLDYMNFLLLYQSSEKDFETLQELVKYTKKKDWAIPFRKIGKSKTSLFRIRKLEDKLVLRLSTEEKAEILTELVELYANVVKRHPLPVLITKKYKYHLLLIRVSLRINPQKTLPIWKVFLGELKREKVLFDLSFVNDLNLTQALVYALSDNWEKAEPMFQSFKKDSKENLIYRKKVLHEVQLLIANGVKHDNLFKVLSLFR